MYTRLYTHVLNRHHWMYSATAFNHAYNDTGLFCISASAPPEQLSETTQVKWYPPLLIILQRVILWAQSPPSDTHTLIILGYFKRVRKAYNRR